MELLNKQFYYAVSSLGNNATTFNLRPNIRSRRAHRLLSVLEMVWLLSKALAVAFNNSLNFYHYVNRLTKRENERHLYA